MNIIVKKRFLEYKGHKFKCAIGKLGYSSSKKEGDLTTPRGIFKLGAIYFRKDRIKSIKTKIKKKIIKKNMGWCDDSLSKEYNQEIKFPYKYSAEKLFRKDKFYDIFINVKSNQNPAKKNRGSAIFLHLTNEKYKPTKGCIAILKKIFLKILPQINKKTKIPLT